jgi:crotonobetainyl-CoA:carnitine CoA-transferase CaiB-like acyl-CoA transferase
MQPFEGIRVVDTTHVIAGPYATYQLALLGADVIKIDRRDEPDQSRIVGGETKLNEALNGIQYLTQAANKRSLSLNLKTEAGRAILKKLAATADIFVENYRPGAFQELGLGYDTLSALNPRLIYCSMSAFGQKGPRAGHTAYDNVIQATSGLMAQTGTPDVHPVKVGAPVVDYSVGLVGAFALSSALFQRARTGKGQYIDLSMLATALMLMSTYAVNYTRAGKKPKPQGNDHTYFATSCCYRTKDGLLMLGATNARQQRRLWTVLNRPDMIRDKIVRDAGDRDNEARVLAEMLLTRTAADWEAVFNGVRVPAARVRSLVETLADPHVAAMGIFHRLADYAGASLDLPLTAFTMAHGGAQITRPPPSLGDTAPEIDGLRYAGAI